MENKLQPPSKRTKAIRGAKRANYDIQKIYEIIDQSWLCHVAFVHDGHANIIPTAHWRIGNYIYVHGARSSRTIRSLQEQEACINISLLDGLVLARSAFHHSMNYRSVVIYGRAILVEKDEEKMETLKAFLDKIDAQRWEQVRRPNAKELLATTVLKFSLDEASAKIRSGPPVDDDDDYQQNVWAGEIPILRKWKNPIADEKLSVPAVPPNASDIMIT